LEAPYKKIAIYKYKYDALIKYFSVFDKTVKVKMDLKMKTFQLGTSCLECSFKLTQELG